MLAKLSAGPILRCPWSVSGKEFLAKKASKQDHIYNSDYTTFYKHEDKSESTKITDAMAMDFVCNFAHLTKSRICIWMDRRGQALFLVRPKLHVSWEINVASPTTMR